MRPEYLLSSFLQIIQPFHHHHQRPNPPDSRVEKPYLSPKSAKGTLGVHRNISSVFKGMTTSFCRVWKFDKESMRKGYRTVGWEE